MVLTGNLVQGVAVTLLVYTLYLAYQGLYNVFLHPLSKFKGPKLWAVTRLRYVLSVWSGRLHSDIQKLHQQYGDVVRIAPDEISFARPDAWQDVYSNAPGRPAFPKSKLWHGSAPGRPMSILNALDPKVHSRFRKAMDPGFTERAVRLQEPIIQSYVSLFIKQLDSLVATSDEGIVTDIVRWFGFVTFDLTGDLGFGEPFGCLESSEFYPWVSLIFSSLRAATYRASLRYYPSMDWLLRFAVPRSVMQKQLEHWQLTVDKINRRLSTEKQRTDLISMIQRDDEGIHGLTLPELRATASVIIVAGSETTVSVLTGAINYLVRNPAKFDRICLEIRARFSNEDDMSLAALEDLSCLNAVIQEGLRLCNPTPVGLPRVVPQGGGTVSGYQLPEGTFVNVHPLTLSRSPTMFHDPDGFHPERWMPEGGPVFSSDVQNAVQAFGIGPRSCIGRLLAWAEMRLILARLLWRFDLQMAETPSGRLKWDEQRAFTVVERKPFDIRLKLREGMQIL